MFEELFKAASIGEEGSKQFQDAMNLLMGQEPELAQQIQKLAQAAGSAGTCVTNYYLVGKLSTSLNLSSYLVSSWSKSLSISGGDSSCSWVLVCALGLIVKEEFKSVMLGRGWRCGELLVSSSTFAVIQRIRKSVPPQKHPHWKNTNTQLQYSLYCYSLDW